MTLYLEFSTVVIAALMFVIGGMIMGLALVRHR